MRISYIDRNPLITILETFTSSDSVLVLTLPDSPEKSFKNTTKVALKSDALPVSREYALNSLKIMLLLLCVLKDGLL